MRVSPSELLQFWFGEITAAAWWKKDPTFDDLLRSRFGALHVAAARCELYGWRNSPEGRLAEVLVLDQFSRNIHRDTAAAFAHDALALALAQEAVADSSHRHMSNAQRHFLYMPFMHSESLAIHEVAMILFDELGDAGKLDFELRHKRIIERFGRYPHRNAILGRVSTPEEEEFLEQPGSAF